MSIPALVNRYLRTSDKPNKCIEFMCRYLMKGDTCSDGADSDSFSHTGFEKRRISFAYLYLKGVYI